MKSALPILAACLVLGLTGAQAPRPMYSPPRLKEISGRPVIDMNGVVVAFPVKVTFETINAMPSGAVESQDLGSVEFDLRAVNGSVVIDGEEIDYREIADALIAAAKREWSKVSPEPLPQRRRSLRTSGNPKK